MLATKAERITDQMEYRVWSVSAPEAPCPEPSTGKGSDSHKWMQYSEKHVVIHCFFRPTQVDAIFQQACCYPLFFNLSAFSTFQQDVFTCVWHYADPSFLLFIQLYLITKGVAKSSTVNVDSDKLNGEAEITKFFILPKSTWHVKVIRLHQA